jgi:hypothetical protein
MMLAERTAAHMHRDIIPLIIYNKGDYVPAVGLIADILPEAKALK